MARPREFDETAVLDAALATFWDRGYEATSIDDLVDATGVGRASLYGAFQDKERFFARVVEHYLALAKSVEADNSGAPPARVLERLVMRWVNAMCDSGSRGCFLSMASVAGDSAPLVRKAFLRDITDRTERLERLIRRGQAHGDLRRDRSARALAELLIVFQQGLATSARAGIAKSKLRRAAKETLDYVTGRA